MIKILALRRVRKTLLQRKWMEHNILNVVTCNQLDAIRVDVFIRSLGNIMYQASWKCWQIEQRQLLLAGLVKTEKSLVNYLHLLSREVTWVLMLVVWSWIFRCLFAHFFVGQFLSLPRSEWYSLLVSSPSKEFLCSSFFPLSCGSNPPVLLALEGLYPLVRPELLLGRSPMGKLTPWIISWDRLLLCLIIGSVDCVRWLQRV